MRQGRDIVKVKLLSVQADEAFRAIRVGDETGRMSANEKLERQIQTFLDENTGIEIKHLQFSSVAIVPKNATWGTTNTHIDWEIEKSVLIIYEGGV
jgi:hypothetical protein